MILARPLATVIYFFYGCVNADFNGDRKFITCVNDHALILTMHSKFIKNALEFKNKNNALEPNTIDIIVREGLGQSAVTAIESMYGCGIKDCGMLTLLKLAEVAEQLIMEELLSDIAEALNACQISNEELYYYFNKLLFIEKIQ